LVEYHAVREALLIAHIAVPPRIHRGLRGWPDDDEIDVQRLIRAAGVEARAGAAGENRGDTGAVQRRTSTSRTGSQRLAGSPGPPTEARDSGLVNVTAIGGHMTTFQWSASIGVAGHELDIVIEAGLRSNRRRSLAVFPKFFQVDRELDLAPQRPEALVRPVRRTVVRTQS